MSILFTFKNFNKGIDGQNLVDIKENTRFNLSIDYPCTSFGQYFVNYLGFVFFLTLYHICIKKIFNFLKKMLSS